MENVLHVNSTHLGYLRPLLKWRIMDLQSLWQECESRPKYKNFHRIIRVLEKHKILEGHRDPFSQKKYLYLGHAGESILQTVDHPVSICKETLLHDQKVSEIAREFLKLDFIDEAELEHELFDKSNFKVKQKLIPDALLKGTKNNHPYSIAFELELSKKSNQRLIDKAKMYLDSSLYDYVMYFFAQEKFLEKYTELFKRELPESHKTKIMFFYNQHLTGKSFDLSKSQGVFKDQKLELHDLFNKNTKN